MCIRDSPTPEGRDPARILPFKGDIDLDALERTLTDHAGHAPLAMITVTNNSGGGDARYQSVSRYA